MDAELNALAAQVGQALKQAGLSLATAESCTGGWVGEALTSVAGSSQWYERGFITYSNMAKREMLGVKTAILSRFGAVSEHAARAMAEGALAASHADVALAITGIAGPGGGSMEKPVGTVCFAWAARRAATAACTRHYHGDRESIRRSAVAAALEGVLDLLNSRSVKV